MATLRSLLVSSILAVTLFLPTLATAQTITVTTADDPRAIPDNDSTGVTSTVVVEDNFVVADVNLVIDSLPHTCLSDLTVILTSPAGTTRTILETGDMFGFPDCPNDLVETTLDDEAATNLGDGAPPFRGFFNVETSTVKAPLSAFAGEESAGVWSLQVRDLGPLDVGTLESWSLTLTTLSTTEWEASGPGYAELIEDAPIRLKFVYDNLREGFRGTWQVSATALRDGPLALPFNYDGSHASAAVEVNVIGFVTDADGVTTETTLVDLGPTRCCSPPSVHFTESGVFEATVRAGDTVGFRFGGRNSDDDNFLRGSFSVFDEPLGPGLDSACIGKDSSGNVDGDEFCDDVDPCNGDQRVGFADGDSVCGAEELCFGRDATGDRDLDAICNDLDLCIGEDISGDTDDDNVCDDVDQCLGNDNAGDTDDDGVCNDIDVQLVSLQELEPGDDDCPTGGTAILIGSDDGGEGAEAGNQELEPSEIDQTVFACNGLDGQNQDGTSCAVESGDDGAVSITCEDGTFATVPSEDAGGSSSCSVSDDGDGTVRIVCPDGSEAEVESAGGCSTAPLDPSRSGFWLLATIGMLRLLRRRQTA